MFLTNHDSQWGRSEVVIIYPDLYANGCASLQILYNRFDTSLYFFHVPQIWPTGSWYVQCFFYLLLSCPILFLNIILYYSQIWNPMCFPMFFLCVSEISSISPLFPWRPKSSPFEVTNWLSISARLWTRDRARRIWCGVSESQLEYPQENHWLAMYCWWLIFMVMMMVNDG